MITLRLHLLRLFPFFWGGHRQLALENLALREQLAVYKGMATGPSFARLIVSSGSGWPGSGTGWRQPLVIVTPDTVLRWQRRRFREHWIKLSGPPIGDRPPVNAELKAVPELNCYRSTPASGHASSTQSRARSSRWSCSSPSWAPRTTPTPRRRGTQQVPHWIASHTRAFTFFGGVTSAVVCDQLKSGVIVPCRYEPGLQRA